MNARQKAKKLKNIIIYCPNCGMKHRIKFLDNEKFDVEFKCQCGEIFKVESEDVECQMKKNISV